MSDDLRENGCDGYANDLAELALGVLTGRARAQALSHVESCPRCAEELEQLSRVADTVVQAAPELEPPMGFEVRLFERMGVADVLPRRRLRPSFWVPAVVAAAAAAVVLGLGLCVVPGADRHGAGPPPDGGVGRPRRERRDGRARGRLRGYPALDVDDAG